MIIVCEEMPLVHVIENPNIPMVRISLKSNSFVDVEIALTEEQSDKLIEKLMAARNGEDIKQDSEDPRELQLQCSICGGFITPEEPTAKFGDYYILHKSCQIDSIEYETICAICGAIIEIGNNAVKAGVGPIHPECFLAMMKGNQR